MAAYLDILKIDEQPQYAEYSFATTDDRRGVLRFDKETGKAELKEPMVGDTEGVNYARAVRKITLAWRGNKALPVTLVWAS